LKRYAAAVEKIRGGERPHCGGRWSGAADPFRAPIASLSAEEA
jgi:hypothetical protein